MNEKVSLISCVYTADKNRKLKRWKDGFIRAVNGKVTIYNDEKKAICSFCSRRVKQEYETPGYIVYIEDYEKLGEQKKNGKRSVEEILEIIDTVKKNNPG